MRKLLLTLLLLTFYSSSFGRAMIDQDVLDQFKPSITTHSSTPITLIIFLKTMTETLALANKINAIPDSTAQPLHFMPAIVATIPRQLHIVNGIANHPLVTQISSHKPAAEELELSAKSILLRPSRTYPNVNNWWDAGFTGQTGVVGLIDSGVAIEHPGLMGKHVIIRQEVHSNYEEYVQGVRSPHGTGVACIYAGLGSGLFAQELGLAYDTPTILAGLADEDTDNTNQQLTTTTLDWMLTRSPIRPTIINYSYGNGPIDCANCSDWSALAKIVDYVVNHEHILWVKSAGNNGFVSPQIEPTHHSTMTIPADNYNGITVANMDVSALYPSSPNRRFHAIRYTSSRGPTLDGRKKPDLSAPGHNTRTCAPDPDIYPLSYRQEMDYHDGYRLMGGTSSATPHVGASALLLQSAGINNPMAIKALLINSADAWTDQGHPGPKDPRFPYAYDHHEVEGSEWNPTYGWGYLNMQKAFDQRHHIIEDQVTLKHSYKEYAFDLPRGGKVTLVHERRVGFNDDNTPWPLSHLTLELYDATTHTLLAADDSAIDTVHQVANCRRKPQETACSDNTTEIHAIVRVTLKSSALDGASSEPFALVYG